MDRPSFTNALRLGQLAYIPVAPSGVADYSNLLEDLINLASKCATIQASDEQSLSRIVAELTDLTQDERVRAVVFALILRSLNTRVGYCPKELVLDLTDPARLKPIIEELSIVGVDFDSVGGIEPRFEELSVFTEPVLTSAMHRLGFAVRHLQPWTWPDPMESRITVDDLEFEFINAAEVVDDGQQDRFEGFEDWIDMTIEEWESQGDDDE